MEKLQEIDIDGVSYGGAGVGRIDGKVCFIEGALPGEHVLFKRLADKGRFITGQVADIIKPSPERVMPVCPYYEKCGGCQYQHLAYEREVFYKGEQVKQILDRIGCCQGYVLEDIVSYPPGYNYRSSVTVHSSDDGYGFFSKDNSSIVAITLCPIACDEINDAILKLSPADRKKDITIKRDNIGNTWISQRAGHRFFKDDFLGTRLTFSPMAFSQVNRAAAIDIMNWLGGQMRKNDPLVLFDVYCGTGFFGLMLRSLFKAVIGIDNDPLAIDCAVISKKDLSADNVKFYCGNAQDKLKAVYDKFHGKRNAVLVDPPRSGISPEMVSLLNGLKDTDSLYYISCHPATLARDLKSLTASKAWRLERVACFDMFSRTKHIESAAFLVREDYL
ncbi:MAG: methyltransferase domain-containing protein [Candidatus Omnitrophica bacterium]|jgi:23S rRNA (uracil1939-C5)-methyltransferase|nr:methyltransferase domain-containing protein [Candidatus Omnitrophota bacterium]